MSTILAFIFVFFYFVGAKRALNIVLSILAWIIAIVGTLLGAVIPSSKRKDYEGELMTKLATKKKGIVREQSVAHEPSVATSQGIWNSSAMQTSNTDRFKPKKSRYRQTTTVEDARMASSGRTSEEILAGKPDFGWRRNG